MDTVLSFSLMFLDFLITFFNENPLYLCVVLVAAIFGRKLVKRGTFLIVSLLMLPVNLVLVSLVNRLDAGIKALESKL